MKRITKKMLSLILAAIMLISLAPTLSIPAFAADSGGGLFEDLGFELRDPSPGEESNPYGRDKVTVQEVSELYIGGQNPIEYNRVGLLYGDDTSFSYTTPSFSSNNTADANKYDAYLTAVGDFTGSGKRDKIIVLGANTIANSTVANRSEAGLFMFFIEPTTGDVSGGVDIFTLYQGAIGNAYELDKNGSDNGTGGYLRYDGSTNGDKGGDGAYYNPIMLHNYMQVVTGDFTGDGIDEIAVYVPDPANPRVEVYQFQSGGGDTDWWTKSKWSCIYTHSLGRTGKDAPNRVSLAAGDLDYDGIDDLAIGSGSDNYDNTATSYSLFGNNLSMWPHRNSGVFATNINVFFGDGAGNPLRSFTQLTLGGSADFAYEFGLDIGDPQGTGRDKLIVAGLTNVIKSGSANGSDGWFFNSNTFIYTFQHDAATGKFTGTQLFADEVEGKKDTAQVYPHVRSDVVALSRGIGQGDNIYYRGFLYTVDGGDVTKAEASIYADWSAAQSVLGDDIADAPGTVTFAAAFEYGLSAADFDGDGIEELVMSYSPVETNNDGPVACPTRIAVLGQAAVTTDNKTGLVSNQIYKDSQDIQSGLSANKLRSYMLVATPDTDSDSRSLTFKSRTFAYTDPELLAVMAGAPLWKDLEHLDQGDGYIGESGTSWATMSGSGSGSSNSNQFSLGAYIGYEYEVPMVASVEMEAEYKHSWTKEYEEMTTVTESVSYGASGYTDAVALYSIPVDVYIFEETVDGETQEVYINFPHAPSVTVMSVDEYDAIAENYAGVLPTVRGTMLTHTQGRPDTYAVAAPAASGNISDVRVYGGNFSGVGYGAGTQSQTISIETEESTSTKTSNEFSFKLGGGAGGFKAGIILGGAWERGKTSVTISGTEFSGEVYNMPDAARNYGYTYAWKIMQYWYKFGDDRIPVVSYIVSGINTSNIIKPPENLNIEAADSTMTTLTLTWDYDTNASIDNFRIYRREIGGAWAQVLGGTVAYSVGRGEYEYVNTGLAPGTEYTYRVVAEEGSAASVPSDTASGWTLATDQLSVTLSTYALTAYPDRSYTVSSTVNSAPGGGATSYSWEKYSNGKWAATGVTTANLSFTPKAATAGEYRLKVTQTVAGAPALAYSPTLTIDFSKYDADITATVTPSGNNLTFAATLKNGTPSSGAIPGGTVTFEVVKDGGEPVFYTVDITISGAAKQGTATAAIPNAADGYYSVTSVYSGDANFYYQTALTTHFKGSGTEFFITGPSEIYYGLPFTPAIWMANSVGLTQITETNDADGYRAEFTKVEYIDSSGSWVTADGRYYSRSSLTITPIVVLYPSGDTRPYHYRATYTIKNDSLNVDETAVFYYKVKQMPVTITAHSFEIEQDSIVTGSLEMINDTDYFTVTSSIAGGGLMRGDLASYFFAPRVYNNGGQEVAWSSALTPATYTMKAVRNNSSAGNAQYLFYDFTLVSGTVDVTGKRYPVTMEVNNGNYGSVSVSPDNEQKTYIYGTNLTFTAAPALGYEVEKWELITGTNEEPSKTQTGGETFKHTMQAADVKVKVFFEQKDTKLTYGAQPVTTGSVTVLPDITSGAQVLEGTPLTFTAVADDGYEFAEWWVYTNGRTTYYAGEPDGSGGFALALNMPGYSTDVTAKFERPSYMVTLSDGLTATYENSRGQTVTVKSGDYVVGDTTLTVIPDMWKTVTAWTETPADAVLTDTGFNSVEQKCTYTITEAAAFTATVSTFYNLTVNNPPNGTIAVEIDGVLDDTSDFTVGVWIESGEQVTLTATPDNGYAIGYWTQGGLVRDLFCEEISFKMTSGMTMSHVFSAVNPNPVVTYGAAIQCDDANPDSPVTPGTQLRFTADIPVGQKVVNWTVKINDFPVVAQSGGITFALAMPNYNIDVAVATAAQTYSVTVNNDDAHGNYTLDCGADIARDNVPVGSKVTLNVEPRTNWRILNVTGAEFVGTNGGVSEYEIASLNADATITITYADDTDYIITVGNTTNGTVTAPASAKAGNPVSLTVTPENGYKLDSLTVKKANGEPVVVGVNHAFTMPDSNVTVTAVFAAASTGGGGGGGGGSPAVSTVYFETNGGSLILGQQLKSGDNAMKPPNPVKAGYRFDGWYLDADLTIPYDFAEEVAGNLTLYAKWVNITGEDSDVSALLNTGDHMAYVQGIGGDLFAPQDTLTRAEAAQIFYNLLRDKNVRLTKAFPDVSQGAWYYTAVGALASMDIITGYPDGRFYPNEPLTRAQLAAIVVRFAKVSPGELRFSDVPATHWAYDYINTAANFGWVTGVGGGRFEPERSITRAEAVTLMNRVLRRYPDKTYIDSSSNLMLFTDVDKSFWAFHDIVEASNTHDYEKDGETEFWK